MTRVDSPGRGFIVDQRTLAALNVASHVRNPTSSYGDSSFVVQVTPKGAILLEYDMGPGEYVEVARHIDSIQQVVAASINASQIVLALPAGKLVILNVDGHNLRMVV